MIRIFGPLLDVIYPPRCLLCRTFLRKSEPKSSICPACLADFRTSASPLCPICGRSYVRGVEEDHTCEDCLRKRPFYQSANAPYLYEGPLVSAVQEFKYGKKATLANVLGPLLADFAETRYGFRKDLLIMPVPLHPKRLRERGFNQSLLLARHVAGGLQAQLDYLSLRRTRYTAPQTGLGREKRGKNVKGAFEVEEPSSVDGKSILLVDDVSTTGHTLNECARVLRQKGCEQVSCLVLARATRL
jgi:ComF family protein